MKTPTRTLISTLTLFLLLSACAPTPQPATPTISLPTSTALPAAVLPSPTAASAPTIPATPTISGDLFAKISYSTDELRLKCDPQEIIFNVTTKDQNVSGVVFLFRLKDKATGLSNPWSNGDDMRSVGGGVFQFVFPARAIPDEARYKSAWLQVQFVGINRTGDSLGHSQIFTDQLTYTTACP
jgi:hypothetical protein